MKKLAVFLFLAFAIMASAAGGYWLGFRHAWDRGLMADAPVRGALAMHYLRALEMNRIDNLRVSFEANIDSGLMLWAMLEEYPLFGIINGLSGDEVSPELEKYVRRIATYRKSHESPLRNPTVIAKMLAQVRESDPDFAEDLEVSGREGDAAMDRMIDKYAE
jgi:hypothetical protein